MDISVTKEEMQEAYKFSSDFSRKMLLISIKSLFGKEKVAEAHWLEDENWWNMSYKED